MNTPVASESNPNAALNAYLERQGRNEYINLATQVGYDGTNIAFVFFENQVRRLMNESPHKRFFEQHALVNRAKW